MPVGKKRFKTRFCHRKTQNTYPRTLPIVTATRVNAQNKLTAVSWRFRQLTQISIITTKQIFYCDKHIETADGYGYTIR